MKDVVRASCPGCQRSLNVPAAWVGRTVKCKHCGHGMLVRSIGQAAVPVAAPAVPLATAVGDTPAPIWEPMPDDLPEYTPPVAPSALPAPLPQAPQAKYVTAFDAGDRHRGRGSYRGPRKRGWVKFVVFGAVFVLLGGLGVFGANKFGLLRPKTPEGEGGGGGTPPGTAGGGGGGGGGQPVAGQFPRRMLAISIHSYLYANPLHNGDSGFAMDDGRRTGTDAAVQLLADRLRIPKEQRYHLTDAPSLAEKRRAARGEKAEPKAVPAMKGGKDDAMAKDAAPMTPPVQPPARLSKVYPLKSVIEGTVSQFVDTSREQDRVVILFCGHALEKKGKAYLVPLEGDLDEVDTLIPLDWFYEKLAACKAQEKVVIFDVARLNPEKGIERPSPGTMTEALEVALHRPPDGVTVITSCSKDEQSIELEDYPAEIYFDTPKKGSKVELHGSFFLSLLRAASDDGALSPAKGLPSPTDELPTERFVKWMRERVGQVTHFKFPERTQTLKATIKKRPDVAYNPAEPMPDHFEFPAPPPSADPRAVLAIVREVQLPPVKSFREDAPPPSVSDVLPFTQEALKDYLAGELKSGEKPNEFQKAILDAVTGMRAMRASEASNLPEAFGGETSDKAKEELRKVQEVPARVEAELQDMLDDLEKVADQKDKQPKRWQVHYDYIVAQLKLRICYAHQYNLALANVRAGKLPDLKPGENGYRLTAEATLDKNTPPDYKEKFAEARKALTDLAKENPNTPWALLAKSDRTVAIGLRLTGGTVAGGF
jgi:hypothetical protein